MTMASVARALRPLARTLTAPPLRPPRTPPPTATRALRVPFIRPFATSHTHTRSHSADTPSPPSPDDPAPTPSPRTPIGRIERRLQITFTCTATHLEGQPCGHRSTHEFSKRSYEHGIVLVECPECQNRHLIADNLSWFSDTPSPAHPKGLPAGHLKPKRTVEDLLKEKGEQVKWIDGGPQGATWELEG